MQLEIRPDPSPEEREALVRALGSADGDGAEGERSAWWRAGVRENLGEARDAGLGS